MSKHPEPAALSPRGVQTPKNLVSSLRSKEPQVFESKDEPLPASPSVPTPAASQRPETKSEDIDSTNIRPQLAFEQFAGKVFDPSAVDFADAAIKAQIQKVSSQRAEFTSLPRSQQLFESPLERFNRIKQEISQFQDDLKTLSSKAGKEDASANVANALAHEVTKLEGELNTAAQNKAFKAFLDPTFRDPAELEQKNILDRLIQDMEQFGSSKSEEKAQGSGKITYELYYNPQKDVSRSQLSTIELDKRISVLEKTLGNASEEKALGFPDVHAALLHLSKRMELLDPTKLDSIRNKMKAVQQELDTIFQTREKIEANSASGEKVKETYEMMVKWDESAQQLPHVIARLQSLKELHEESASAVIRLQSIDSEHEQLAKLLQQDKLALERVEKNLANNLKIMQGNLKALETRFTEINSKLSK